MGEDVKEEQVISDLQSGIEQKIKQIDKTLIEINTLFDGKIDVLKNKHKSKSTEKQRVNSIVEFIEQKVLAKDRAETIKYKFKSIETRLKKLREVQNAT